MKFSVFIKYLIIFFISLNITQLVKADLASDLLKKAQELAEKKKIVGKKLEAFILSNVITIDFDGKEQTYKFNKDITYEVYENAKIIGDGTWAIKGLTKNSIKLSGYKDIYFQIYNAKDRISTVTNLKKKKDSQTNRKILRISSPNNFKEQLVNLKNKKAAKEKKLAEEKAAKEKKLADEKIAKEKRLAEEKAAKEKKIADEKIAKENKLAEEKATKEKLEKKLSLLPVETDLKKGQNFLSYVQDFIKLYPEEFGIVKLSELLIATRPIINGSLDNQLKNDLELLKEFTGVSNKFIKYINEIKNSENNKRLIKIDKKILNLEKNTKIIKRFLVDNPNSTQLEEWLNNLKIAEKLLDELTSYDQLLATNENLIKLINTKKEFDEAAVSINSNIKKLKEYLKINLTSDLALSIIEQIKSLEAALKKENLKDIISSNEIAKEFIYIKFLEPEEKRKEEKRKAEEQKRIAEEQKRIAEIKEKIAEEKRVVEERITEEKRVVEERIAEEKRIVDERIAEEKRIVEEKIAQLEREKIETLKKLEDTFKKFKATTSFQKNIIQILQASKINYEDIKFPRKDKVVEIYNLTGDADVINDTLKISKIEINGLNSKYIGELTDIISMQFDQSLINNSFLFGGKYNGKYFDKIKISGIEMGEPGQKINIDEFGFDNLDFKKQDAILKIIQSNSIDELQKNSLSLILSMTFDKFYLKNINYKDKADTFILEYFEISDWSELSVEKILTNNLLADKSNIERFSYDRILIEDIVFDVDSVLSLLSSGYDKKFINGDNSQIANSFKSLGNFQIENFKFVEDNKQIFSLDLAQLEDLNFDYFGNSGEIKVPTSFNFKIEGSDFNSSELDKTFGNMFSKVGYNSIKFDFGTEWEWKTNKNNILLNLDLGITDAASINLSSNFTDFNTDILTLKGAPLITYLLTNPKLKDFNLSLKDNSLKDKLITAAAQEANMTTDQYRDFLTQSLDIYAATLGVDQKIAKDMKKAAVNFIKSSNKISISIKPRKPTSITELMPDITSQNYENIIKKLNLSIRN